MTSPQEEKAKFEVGDILYLALTLVVAGIGIAIGLNVLSTTKEDFCGTGFVYNSTSDSCRNATNASNNEYKSFELNATNGAIEGVAKFSDKMGLIATVIVAAIVIGILLRYLFVRPS